MAWLSVCKKTKDNGELFLIKRKFPGMGFGPFITIDTYQQCYVFRLSCTRLYKQLDIISSGFNGADRLIGCNLVYRSPL